MYPIRYATSNPSKTFEINSLEEQFFAAFETKWPKEYNSSVKLLRMSDGTLSVECAGYPIGKIKLQGRKHQMQVLRGLNSQSHIAGSIDDFIRGIDKWVEYFNRHIRKK